MTLLFKGKKRTHLSMDAVLALAPDPGLKSQIPILVKVASQSNILLGVTVPEWHSNPPHTPNVPKCNFDMQRMGKFIVNGNVIPHLSLASGIFLHVK